MSQKPNSHFQSRCLRVWLPADNPRRTLHLRIAKIKPIQQRNEIQTISVLWGPSCPFAVRGIPTLGLFGFCTFTNWETREHSSFSPIHYWPALCLFFWLLLCHLISLPIRASLLGQSSLLAPKLNFAPMQAAGNFKTGSGWLLLQY